VSVEVRDVATGLWLWRQPHPAWEEGNDWEPEVSSFAVESRGARLLLDPLAPPPGDELPGGLRAGHDGRGAMETPLFLPEQRALVFADGMTAPGGVLRIWATPWHEERVLPAFRALLALPFEHVLVSHGEPVHTRADFEAALEREPWSIAGYA